ncbi:MAG: DUF6498-containing protein [Patescibacteria group bacterium]
MQIRVSFAVNQKEITRSGLASGVSVILPILILNSIPLVGMFFFDWSALQILLSYWTETVVIAVFTVVKIITAQGKVAPSIISETQTQESRAKSALHFIFFAVLFLYIFLQTMYNVQAPQLDDPGVLSVLPHPDIHYQTLVWMMAGYGVFHLYNFITHFVIKKQYKSVSYAEVQKLYSGKSIALHMALVFGAFLDQYFEIFYIYVVVLVLFKVAGDLNGQLHADQKSYA